VWGGIGRVVGLLLAGRLELRLLLRALLGALGAAGLALLGGAGLELLPDALDAEEVHDGLARLDAVAEPVQGPLAVDRDLRGVAEGVVVAEVLDEAPVTGRADIGDDDAVEGLLLLALAPEAHLDGHGGAFRVAQPGAPSVSSTGVDAPARSAGGCAGRQPRTHAVATRSSGSPAQDSAAAQARRTV
jgi:hypothetical protein